MVLTFASFGVAAQDNSEEPVTPSERKPRFLTGLYFGSYFANKYSASTYSGYGFDVDGNRNSFLNSFMYQKIKNEYGGGYGYYDRIAEALGVDQHQWDFTEADMPVNMRYVPTLLIGLNLKFPLERRGAFIFHVNGAKLNVEGNFTISTLRPQNPDPSNNSNIRTFPITGREQRLQFQFGYQQIFGDDEKFSFFGEIGVNGTLAKFDKNTIFINNLVIDLTYYWNQTQFAAPPPTRNPIGFGLGAFAGLGMNLDVSPRFIVQIFYSLTHEKINIGTNPTLKLQQGVGVRTYFKLYGNSSPAQQPVGR